MISTKIGVYRPVINSINRDSIVHTIVETNNLETRLHFQVKIGNLHSPTAKKKKANTVNAIRKF